MFAQLSSTLLSNFLFSLFSSVVSPRCWIISACPCLTHSIRLWIVRVLKMFPSQSIINSSSSSRMHSPRSDQLFPSTIRGAEKEMNVIFPNLFILSHRYRNTKRNGTGLITERAEYCNQGAIVPWSGRVPPPSSSLSGACLLLQF